MLIMFLGLTMLTLLLAVWLLILGLAMLILRFAVGLLLARPLGLAMLIMLLSRRVFGPGVLGRREANCLSYTMF